MVDETIRLDDTERRKPRRSHWPLAIAGVAAVAAIGAGVYGWWLRSAYADAAAEAERLRQDKLSLEDALELHRAGETRLGTQLQTCERERDSEQAGHGEQVNELESTLAACKQRMTSADSLLQEFEAISARFDDMIDTGKLDVVFRRGEMVVKLPEAVLFPSGRAGLSERGQRTLAEVAAILEQMPDHRFTVAGHTDNVPVSTDDFASNWELSAARAVAVTRRLIEAGVPPANLAAAGYGEFAPVASNASAAGRRRNRRIEIVLKPDLRPLTELEKTRQRARAAPDADR